MINNDFIGTILPNLYVDLVSISDDENYNIFEVDYSFLETLSDDIFSWSDMPPEALDNIKIAFRLIINESPDYIDQLKNLSSGDQNKFLLKDKNDLSISEIFYGNSSKFSKTTILEDSIFDLVINTNVDPNNSLNQREAQATKELIKAAKGNLLKQYKSKLLSKNSTQIKIPKEEFLLKADLLIFVYYDFGEENTPDIFGKPVHLGLITEQMLDPTINNYKYINTDINYYGSVVYKNGKIYDDTSYYLDETQAKQLTESFITFDKVVDTRLNKMPVVLSLAASKQDIVKKEKYFSKVFTTLIKKSMDSFNVVEEKTDFSPIANTLGNGSIPTQGLNPNPSIQAIPSSPTFVSGRPFASINPEIFTVSEYITSGQEFNRPDGINFEPSYYTDYQEVEKQKEESKWAEVKFHNITLQGIIFFDFIRYFKENSSFPTVNLTKEQIFEQISSKISIDDVKDAEINISDVKIITDYNNDYPLAKIFFEINNSLEKFNIRNFLNQIQKDKIMNNIDIRLGNIKDISIEKMFNHKETIVNLYQAITKYSKEIINPKPLSVNILRPKGFDDTSINFFNPYTNIEKESQAYKNVKNLMTKEKIIEILKDLGYNTSDLISENSLYTIERIVDLYIKFLDPKISKLYLKYIIEFINFLQNEIIKLCNSVSKGTSGQYFITKTKYTIKTDLDQKLFDVICLNPENFYLSYESGDVRKKFIINYSQMLDDSEESINILFASQKGSNFTGYLKPPLYFSEYLGYRYEIPEQAYNKQEGKKNDLSYTFWNIAYLIIRNLTFYNRS